MPPIDKKMRESMLRQYEHTQKRPVDAPIRRCEKMNEMHVKCEKGRPKKTWRETIRNHMTYMTFEEHMVNDKSQWR